MRGRPRPYAEVMEIWHTSCPRLTIWDDAVEPGLVVREHNESDGTVVKVTPLGRSLLMEQGRLPNADAV